MLTRIAFVRLSKRRKPALFRSVPLEDVKPDSRLITCASTREVKGDVRWVTSQSSSALYVLYVLYVLWPSNT